jgi:hypothetical protein
MKPIEDFDKDTVDKIEDAFPKENHAPMNLDKTRVVDLTKAREGTAVKLIPVESGKQNIDLAWRLEYVPDVGMFKAPLRMIKMFFGFEETKVTDEKFPDSAVLIEKTDWTQGPDEIVILLENVEGEAKLSDNIKEWASGQLAEAEEKRGEAESEKMLEKAKNMGAEGGKRAASDKESPSKKRRGSRDKDDRKSRRRKRRKNRR